MVLPPQIITKKGKKEFVVLPYSEFKRITEELENLADLRELRKAKAESQGQPSISLSEAKKELGI